MDIEKTIQFLVENAAQHDARIAVLEKNAIILQNSLMTLTSAVQAFHEDVAGFQQRTEKAMEDLRREMRQRDAESRALSRERDAALDERISKLVSAIAAMANGRANQPPPQH